MILDLCIFYNITLDELYSNYLPITHSHVPSRSINGYYNLTDENRGIVDNLITYLNQSQKK